MKGRTLLGYALMLALFAAALTAVLRAGAKLPVSAAAATAAAPPISSGPSSGLALLLLQTAAILLAAKAGAAAARRLGQPEVVGEMLAGIALGPSLFGLLWPHAQALLFPPASVGQLHFLSQVGLVVFMFLIGLELDCDQLKGSAHSAVLVSHTSIIVPFLLGCALALGLYPRYAPAGVLFLPFGLFMGTAMSVTAFPVLARIIHEKGLKRTRLGTTALTCAAIDDVTAWCALAAVAGVARSGTARGILSVLALSLAFVWTLLRVVGPALRRWLERRCAGAALSRGAVAAALLAALLCAAATEAIGIHALLGAFLAGVVMPRDPSFRRALAVRLEDFTLTLLLPLFFALTGLRTRVGLLDSPAAWAFCGAVILTAVVGKLGGSALAARWSGAPWRESLALGVLMNARGLVELVVLNVGYDLGVISPAVFTMMVLMALATTTMTGPLLAAFLPSGDGQVLLVPGEHAARQDPDL